jgi:hypothetical protein
MRSWIWCLIAIGAVPLALTAFLSFGTMMGGELISSQVYNKEVALFVLGSLPVGLILFWSLDLIFDSLSGS